MKLLSSTQKQALAVTARQAWEAQGRPGSFDEWRRSQVREVCGAIGLTDATNDDYLPLKRRFLSFMDAPVAEFETALREPGEMRRRHMHNLGAALGDGDFPAAYAQKVARDKFGHGMNACTDRELLQLVITIRARVAKKQKARAAA